MDPAKHLRALLKKLRQIEQLESDAASGSKTLSQEQKDKLAKKAALLQDIQRAQQAVKDDEAAS
jgi:uncharacterized protein with WD repeat